MGEEWGERSTFEPTEDPNSLEQKSVPRLGRQDSILSSKDIEPFAVLHEQPLCVAMLKYPTIIAETSDWSQKRIVEREHP